MEDQGREASSHAEESELQRHHHGILEQLRRHLLAPTLDPLGHAQLRQGPAHADHGHRPRGLARALPQHQSGRRLCQVMSPAKKRPKKPVARSRAVSRRKRDTAPAGTRLLSEAELHRIAERIFKLSKADETEVQIEATSDALT